MLAIVTDVGASSGMPRRYTEYIKRYPHPRRLVIGPIMMMVAGSSFAVDSFPMGPRSISRQDTTE